MSRKNDHDLTDDDRRHLRGKLPAHIRELLPRDATAAAKETRFLMETAARLHAEADMLLAAHKLRKARGEAATVDEVSARNQILTRKVEALKTTCSEKDEQIMRLRSLPAQAVHSGGQ